MKFRPALGESDFRKVRESGAGYVDKSGFISEVLDDMSSALLFPRPRRFGKTINLSMLGYFLGKSAEDLSHLFEGLAVASDPKAMAHFQKYPIISVTFKEVKAKTFDEAIAGIREQIASAYRGHRHLLDEGKLDSLMVSKFEEALSRRTPVVELQHSFKWLSLALYEHYKVPVVILIDEYDTPIQSGYLHGYFDDIVMWFRNFFSAALKDNAALFKGVLTGILRVSKENMFSGLNNIQVYSILARDYSTYFGFTEDEVAAIVDPAHLEEVRTWYNGYNFGDQVIYNPWSILSYIKHGSLRPYWVNTGSSDLIEHLVAKQGMGLSEKSYPLLNGETIELPIDDNIVLRDIERRSDALWNFLLFSGYLKIAKLDFHQGRDTGHLCIPNNEIRQVYEDMFRNWLEKADPEWALTKDLVKALLAGDSAKVQLLLGQILVTAMSYQDPAGRAPEKLYHGFMLGLLVHLEPQYDIRSNREAGYGRADVLMRPKTPGKPGVVMEFKVPFGDETIEQALQEAAKQIRERQYAAEVANAGASPVHEYAMAFDGKRAWVKRVDELIG
ncbi:MAG: AAA family ATPase [Polyangiaceae bacterium]|nr:AAA family ATPase [Polyangiaceae bacterium]